MLKFKTRRVSRALWKHLYREFRIARRESMKVMIDVMAYGRGYSRVTPDGVRHVPYEEVAVNLPPVDAAMTAWLSQYTHEVRGLGVVDAIMERDERGSIRSVTLPGTGWE